LLIPPASNRDLPAKSENPTRDLTGGLEETQEQMAAVSKDKDKVAVQDNGPGIVKKQIP